MSFIQEERKIISERIEKLYSPQESKFLALDILGEVLNKSRSEVLALDPLESLTLIQLEKVEQILQRLLQGEPIQYILKKSLFGDLTLEVGKGVLIPRPETEELVFEIIKDNKHKKDLCFLDLGTGTGCIALSLLKNLENSKGFAIEKSVEAIKYAKKNTEKYLSNSLNNSLEIIEGDLCCPEKWKHSLSPLDIIVSNPPYVDLQEMDTIAPHVKDQEPYMALFAPDRDVLFFYKAIKDLCYILPIKENALLYLEINSRFGAETKLLFEEDPIFKEVLLIQDLSGKDRFIKASIVK